MTLVSRTITSLRNLAATLLTASGISHIAALWFRDIDEAALLGALLGALYLIIGIGLYGQSRFTLFIAILVPATGAWLALNHTPVAVFAALGHAQLGADLAVVVISAVVLVAVRNNPSV
jgi:hypothetical protein